MNFSGKVFSQESASAAKQTVKTVHSVFVALDHRAKAAV